MDDATLRKLIRRLGEPSWWILAAFRPGEAIPGIEIIRRVERFFAEADYPIKRLDPSTLHYALRRMEDDGLVTCDGEREVEVPGPRGSLRREMRAVYAIAEPGLELLDRKRAMEAATTRQEVAVRHRPAYGGQA